MDFEHHTPSPTWFAKRHQDIFWNLPASAQARRKHPLARLLELPRRKRLQPQPHITRVSSKGSSPRRG
jgi:hypothetical protein